MTEHKSGFTLLELLIVIIITGVLAGIAMPQLFRNIEHSRATEALESIGNIKRSVEACAMQFNNNYTSCSNFSAIAMTDPSYSSTTNASSHFVYTITTAATTFQIVATRNTIDSGTAGDQVTLSRTATGAVNRAGTTAFTGIQ